MSRRLPSLVLVALAVALPGADSACHAGALVTAAAELQWTAAAVAGVSTAAVSGDPAKGASRFYLKYAAGFVAPPHHHSPDHYVTTVTGTLVLGVGGREYRLAPGSYFALTEGAPHTARCEGSTDCVMFIEARGAWDVVPEPATK